MAVVLDMDGTLYPRAIYQQRYYDFALETIRTRLGTTRDKARQLLQASHISPDPGARQGSVTEVMIGVGLSLEEWNHHRDQGFDLSQLISEDKNLAQLLSDLSRKRHLVLLTNNTRVATSRIISKLGVDPNSFYEIVSSGGGIPVKPSLEAYRHLSSRIGVAPRHMVAVGDRFEVDIRPLLRLGGCGIEIEQPEDIYTACEVLSRAVAEAEQASSAIDNGEE